jgi:hypothetical protein
MTFDDRVRALAPFGFSDTQTRFLATVALHSGFCLHRHYATFAGLQYGAGVRDFFDRLVTRRLARRLRFRRDRGDVFHINNSAIYDAICQNDNRNRRQTSQALIARKLMLLDYVLGAQDGHWLATEQDKVEFFGSVGIPQSHLPQRIFLGRRFERTTRHFIEKFPIQVVGDPPTIHFAYLVTDAIGQAFEHYLLGHLALLRHLGRWRVAAMAPSHIPGLAAVQQVFGRIGNRVPTPGYNIDELNKYFGMRLRFERREATQADLDALKFFHEARERYSGQAFEIALARFAESGELLDEWACAAEVKRAVAEGRGGLITYQLPHRYDRFGSMAGVA